MTDAQKPRLIVVAGPNSSGKTTITEKLLRQEWMEDCQYINPDLIPQTTRLTPSTTSGATGNRGKTPGFSLQRHRHHQRQGAPD